MSKNKIYLLLFLILLIGFGLRLINLGTEPFWGDEALSSDIVRHYERDLSGMLIYLKTVEVHPPLYYLMLNIWSRVFGWGEFPVRLLSVIFGLGVILLAYWLANLLFADKKMALLAAGLTAVLPFQIEFSQEARPYIIFCFFALLSAIIYWQYRRTGKIIFILFYVSTTLVGLFLHYSYAFFAVSLSLYWLLEILLTRESNRRRQFCFWLVAHLFIFLSYFFQLVSLLYKLFLGNYLLFDTPRAISADRPVNFFESVISQLLWETKNEPVNTATVLAIFIFKASLLIIFVGLILKHKDNLAVKLKNQGAPLIFLLTLIFLPLILFLFSPFSFAYAPVYERHMIAGSVLLVLLLCYFVGLFDYKKKTLVIVLFLLSIINPLITVVGDDSIWDGYFRLKPMAEHINISYRPGDIVLISFAIGRSNFNHYLHSEVPSLSLYPLNLFDYHSDFLSSRDTLGLNENEAQLRFLMDKYKEYGSVDLKMNYIIKKYQPKRIWFVATKDYNMTKWFEAHHWRLAMDSLGDLHPLKLYDGYMAQPIINQ